MSDWKNLRGAPDSGTVLCRLQALVEGQAHSLDVNGFPVLLLRKGNSVRAFVNACPHQYLPLDHRGSQLLSADGQVLRCSNHAAGFDATTGEGVEGLGLGSCLDAIPVEVVGDEIRIQ